MEINKNIALAAFGLICLGSAASAQSLDDAKLAINAEQYQKAKSMLKNLTVTEPTKDENYFYLGWVYLKEDEPDSAKMWFNKGIGVNSKSALNYVGLGAVAHLNKDQANATNYFNQALSFTPRRDSKPYVYIGKSYLLTENGGAASTADAQAAFDVLTKGEAVNAKDPELFLALGDADRTLLKSSDAYNDYTNAQSLDPKSPAPDVALGVTLMYANNFDDAVGDYQKALQLDPNYGPAYREWAETDVRWAKTDPKVAVDKANEAVDEYKKYLSLTDMSIQSQLRYADFLTFAGKYQELETVARQLSTYANSNLRVYRYLGYAAYNNKDYPAGLSAMNTWMTKADPKRIIALDYVYLGRLQMALNQDSLGMQSLRKAYAMDTTQTDVLLEVAKSLYGQRKYKEAGEEFALYVSKNPDATLQDMFREGMSYYFAYQEQYASTATPKPVPDSTLLVNADSTFSKIQQKVSKPNADVAIFRARIKDLEEPDRNNIKGLAAPYYQSYIDLTLAKGAPADQRTKNNLVEAYDYLGRYNELIAKDDVKAEDNYNKALAIDPTNAVALDYMKRKKK